MKIKLNASSFQITQKPGKDDPFWGTIRNDVSSHSKEIDSSSLIDIVQKYAFTPVFMTGTDGNTWKSQQVLAVDIDNCFHDSQNKKRILKTQMLPEEAKQTLENYGLDIFLMYRTFSCTEKNFRFRVLLLCDPLPDKESGRRYTNRMVDILNSKIQGCCDTGCSDPARIFMPGGNDCIIFSSSENDKAVSLKTLEALPESESEKAEKQREEERKKKLAEREQRKQNRPEGKYTEIQRDIDRAIHDFDILTEARFLTGASGKQHGKSIRFPVCPACGHKDCFTVSVSGSVWHCFSDTHIGAIPKTGTWKNIDSGGGILELERDVEFFRSGNLLSFGEARDRFISQHTAYSPDELKRLYAQERSMEEAEQRFSSSEKESSSSHLQIKVNKVEEETKPRKIQIPVNNITVEEETKPREIQVLVKNIDTTPEETVQIKVLNCDPSQEERKTARYNPDSQSFQIQGTPAKRIHYTTATDLKTEKITPVEWLVPNMIAEKQITLLGAKRKSGKSFFDLQASISICKGEKFLGIQCKKAGVIFIDTEGSKARIKARMNMLLSGNAFPENMIIIDKADLKTYFKETKKVLRIGNDLKTELKEIIETNPDKNIRFVVIDMLKFLLPIQGKNEDDYSFAYRSISELQDIASELGLAFLVLIHTRKDILGTEDGDPFDELYGSTGWGGAVETMITWRRNRKTGEWHLYTTGRDVFEELDLIVELDKKNGCTWKRIGTSEEVERKRSEDEFNNSTIKKTILKLLEQSNGEWQGTPGQIKEASVYFHDLPSIAEDVRKIGAFIQEHKNEFFYIQISVEYKVTNKGTLYKFKDLSSEKEKSGV